jgi:hypothetical protein
MKCLCDGNEVEARLPECIRCRIVTLEQIFCGIFVPADVQREIERLKGLVQ